MNKIGLNDRLLIDSYLDIKTADCSDGKGFYITDEKTVADLYDGIIRKRKMLLEDDGFTVVDYGIWHRKSSDICYIRWKEYDIYDNTSRIEHEELIAIYTFIDDWMVLIPLTADPITSARYIDK